MPFIVGRKKYRCVAEGEAVPSIPAELDDLDLARAAKRGGVSRARRGAEAEAEAAAEVAVEAAASAKAKKEAKEAKEEKEENEEKKENAKAAAAAAVAVAAEEEARRVAPDAHDWEIAAGVVEADDGTQDDALHSRREEKAQRERERQERLKILRSWS